MRKERIELGDTMMSAVMKLCEGNPGALRVCMELMSRAVEIDPDSMLGELTYLLSLDTYSIYGARIWMLYKDVCGQDIVKTMGCLRSCQMGLLSNLDLDAAIDGRSEIDVDGALTMLSARLPRWGGALAAQYAEKPSVAV